MPQAPDEETPHKASSRGALSHKASSRGAAPRGAVLRVLSLLTLIALLTLSGIAILTMVRRQTGTEGFLVGCALAVFPVPALVTVFRWLDRVEPEPWRNLAFAFAWGACAATLVAIVANGFATQWLSTNIASVSPTDAETWSSTVVAPVVEESAKAAAILLLFVFRRRHVDGITDGIVIAGLTATGFAFTENVLYLGNAFGRDLTLGSLSLHSLAGLADSLTAGTFFVRVIMSPFAHPLFTVLTGLAFGIAATRYPHHRPLRVALPVLGLTTAILLHSIWNSASSLGSIGFLAVYGLFMVPVFAAVSCLAVWSRREELLSLRTYLPPYAAAGWLTPTDPLTLSSLKTRALARTIARRTHGPAAARAVTEYAALATSLAFLRRRAHRTGPTPDFHTRERTLLHHLWQTKPLAHPALTHAHHSRHQAQLVTAQEEVSSHHGDPPPGSDL
ncbi:PrsW family intramembrane metalloprotease [Streptomyces sclerotialus]|uniref:PrsW family intramembrane metalloprotease n=1 Tax=Streptomyces sclerotialus TaxID=1957 RepID=UPI00099D3BBC